MGKETPEKVKKKLFCIRFFKKTDSKLKMGGAQMAPLPAARWKLPRRALLSFQKFSKSASIILKIFKGKEMIKFAMNRLRWKKGTRWHGATQTKRSDLMWVIVFSEFLVPETGTETSVPDAGYRGTPKKLRLWYGDSREISKMDVYKLDQSISSNIGNAPPPEKIQPQVTFDAGAEFNLSFFDNPDDHESTQGFSDPGSVGSAPEPSPPPPPQQSPLTPQQTASSSSSSSSSLVQLQPPTSSVAIKQGRDSMQLLCIKDRVMVPSFNNYETVKRISPASERTGFNVRFFRVFFQPCGYRDRSSIVFHHYRTI